MNNKMKPKYTSHCMKITKNENILAEICGKLIDNSRIFENNGLLYRIDLCKEHYEELEKAEKVKKEKKLAKEKERKEKEAKDFIETDMICPHCGEKVYKHFHRYDDYLSQTIEYRMFWCRNMCDLGCGCCIKVDTHGECCAYFCHNKNSWKPIEKKF